jgi:predicted Zn-ribbon and HTH transcriptional regulator
MENNKTKKVSLAKMTDEEVGRYGIFRNEKDRQPKVIRAMFKKVGSVYIVHCIDCGAEFLSDNVTPSRCFACGCERLKETLAAGGNGGMGKQ